MAAQTVLRPPPVHAFPLARCLLQSPAMAPSHAVTVLRSLVADEPSLAAMCDVLAEPSCAEACESLLRASGEVPSRPGSRARTGVHTPHPDLYAELLADDVRVAAKAGATLLEEVPFLFCTDLRSHGLSTSQRVSPLQGSVLALMLGALLRRLGLQRTMLLVRQGHEIEVLPTVPPSVVFGTDLPLDDPTVRFRLARALAATHPDHLLWSGLPFETSRAAYDAIAWAFGTPPESATLAHAAGVGRRLHLLPARTQRELRRGLAEGALPPFETVRRLSSLSVHQAALVATGDVGAAIVVAAREESLGEPRGIEGMAAVLRGSALARELLRFAVGETYAKLRAGAPWPVARPAPRIEGARPRPVRRPVTNVS